MLATTMNWLLVLAAEGHGIPGSDWRAKLAVPIGFLLFVGTVYMLVRANLGTRRGYLVSATSLFGFMIIYSLFWTFGAPGTPPATGPQNLPGQQLDAYEDTWRPFAADSKVAEDPNYAEAKTHPEGWTKTPEEAGLEEGFVSIANTGSDDIKTFFSTQAGPLQQPPLGTFWKEVDRHYQVAENGRPMIAVQYQQTYQIAKVAPGAPPPEEGAEPALTPDGDTVAEDESNLAPPGTKVDDLVENGEVYTAFAYFDAGSEEFPSLVVFVIFLVLFIIHALLLARDERRERREREAAVGAVAAEERVPAEASHT